MYLVLIFLIIFSFSAPASAQDSPNTKDPLIRLKNPKALVTLGLSPHYSSFNFDFTTNYGIRNNYALLKAAPLTYFHFNARTDNLSISYSLQTTYPLQPAYTIYERSGALLNRSIYNEWTQMAGFKINVFRNLMIGLAYHHRTISFRGNDLSSTVNFEFYLQDQKNLLFTVEKLFTIDQFLIKPSVSYSLRKWSGAGNNFFSRSTPDGEQTVPINRDTYYVGAGIMAGNDAIAKNVRLNFRYEFHDNFMIGNKRYLFGIQYTFNVLDLL